jgi:hypothetical protein
MHVREHVVDPVAFLQELRARTTELGSVLIEVPHTANNPFDLLIADHCTHFSPERLGAVLRAGGWNVTHLASDWVAKELSLLATPSDQQAKLNQGSDIDITREMIENHVAWFDDVLRQAKSCADKSETFGVFGTAIAGTWLFGALQDAVDFFVDEDPSRAGSSYHGRPSLHPEQAPEGAHVFVAIAPVATANAIGDRLRALGIGTTVARPWTT